MLIIDPSRPVFKGNTHVHTKFSDGRKTFDECLDIYEALGHDFLVVTDHWHMSEETKRGNMLVMRGIEYDFSFEHQVLHVVGVLPAGADPEIERGDDYMHAIARINEVGGAAICAHPAWSMNTLEMLLSFDGIAGAEVYNAVSGIPYGVDRAYSGAQLDIAANHGRLFTFFTGDDTHYYEGEPGSGRNMVQADECTSESIIAAMKAGRMYCTQGPEIIKAEYDPEKRVYSVDCTPASHVVFFSNAPWTPNRCINGDGLTHAEYELRPNEQWIRCEVVDANGKRAWISPVKA